MKQSRQSDEAFLTGRLDKLKRGRRRRGALLRGLLALAVLWAVLHYLLGFAVTQGDGMAPAFAQGTLVMYLRVPGSLARGDVVLAQDPDGGTMLRRVLAVGGDTVTITNDSVMVDGVAESGLNAVGATHLRDESEKLDVKLAAGEVFLLADAREIAADSRDHGPVKEADVQGRVLLSCRWFPLDWMDWLIGLVAA